MAGTKYSISTLLTYLHGPGANVVATLQQHCYAAMPGISAKQCSPARGLYRSNGWGAQQTGHTRYPAQKGSVYYTQLTSAQVASNPNVSNSKRTAASKRVGKVWASKQQRASKRGARQAKQQAQQQTAQADNSQQQTANPVA